MIVKGKGRVFFVKVLLLGEVVDVAVRAARQWWI
jgi:hypothetical protein